MNDGPGAGAVSKLAQAIGIVSVQADCSVEEALASLDQLALDGRTTLADIADAVIDGTIRFDE